VLLLKGALTPEFAAYAVRFENLLATRASNDLANLLHVLADTRNGIAAGGSDCDECEGDYFFHAVPVCADLSKKLLYG
jgi:hypothetical protein